MTDPKALLELAERVEKASGPDRELDRLIDPIARSDVVEWPGGGLARKLHDGRHVVHSAAHYTASLDAAMTLVPEGWSVARIGQDDEKLWWVELRRGFITSFDKVAIGKNSVWAPHWDCEPPARGLHGAALALTAACLRALANGGNHG